MKSTTFIAVLLTLLTLLLIAGAAALFLFQGRQDLLDETARLENEVQALNLSATQLKATVDAQEATRQANEATLSQTSVQLAARENELEEALATLEAMEATREAQPPVTDGTPLVDILSPIPESVSSDEDVRLIVVAFAGPGIERLVVRFSDRQQTFTVPGNGEQYVMMDRRLLDPTPGNLTITATLTTIDGQTEQDDVTIPVSNAAPEEDGEERQ